MKKKNHSTSSQQAPKQHLCLLLNTLRPTPPNNYHHGKEPYFRNPLARIVIFLGMAYRWFLLCGKCFDIMFHSSGAPS